MRESTAQPMPQLYAILAEQLARDECEEDTDPFGAFGELYSSADFGGNTNNNMVPMPPRTPRKFRTHEEYQAARLAGWVYPDPLTVTLDVGAWVPDRLLADEETVVVDIKIVAGQRGRR